MGTCHGHTICYPGHHPTVHGPTDHGTHCEQEGPQAEGGCGTYMYLLMYSVHVSLSLTRLKLFCFRLDLCVGDLNSAS